MGEVCDECRFDWDVDEEGAVDVVAAAAQGARDRFSVQGDPHRRVPGVWSPAVYLWHLVDVLRFGAERLVLLRLDAPAGISSWDENVMAEARGSQVSVLVGLQELDDTARRWVAAFRAAPATATALHTELGTWDRLEIARRNAHEVVHHLLDIERGLRTP